MLITECHRIASALYSDDALMEHMEVFSKHRALYDLRIYLYMMCLLYITT